MIKRTFFEGYYYYTPKTTSANWPQVFGHTSSPMQYAVGEVLKKCGMVHTLQGCGVSAISTIKEIGSQNE